jgi:hypothetical protein
VPVLAVGLWLLHATVAFGSPVTSTWLGMNLARTTTTPADHRTLVTLVHDGTLSELALRQPFLPLADYGLRGTSGNPALHRPVKSDGTSNFNDLAYVELSRRFLTDDLAFIHARPSAYLHRIVQSGAIWLVPSDQYFTVLDMQRGVFGSYAHLYDHVLELQPAADPHVSGIALVFHRGPGPASLSWLEMAIGWIDLIGTPVLVASWWRRRRPEAVGLAILGVVCLEWWAASTLIEFGENNRFRFELGPLPLILATAIIAAGAATLRTRRPATVETP